MKKYKYLLIAALLASNAQFASANTWFYLDHVSLLDQWFGPDLMPGTGDPADAFFRLEGPLAPPPTNNFSGVGAMSASRDNFGGYGTVTGTFESNASGPDHPGVNPLSNLNGVGLYHNDFAPFHNSTYSFAFDVTAVNQNVVAPDGRTFTSQTTSIDNFGTVTAFTGNGYNLFATEIVALALAGLDPAPMANTGIDPTNADLITVFNSALPQLPSGWTAAAVTFFDYQVLTGPLGGALGSAVGVTYTMGPIVPVPPALLLFGSAVAGLAGLGRARKK